MTVPARHNRVGTRHRFLEKGTWAPWQRLHTGTPLALVAGTLIGCAAPPSIAPMSRTPERDTSAPVEETPALTAAEVEEVLAQALPFGLPSYGPLLELHHTLLLNGDEECPSVNYMSQGDANHAVVWHADDCTASTGWHFDGNGQEELITEEATGESFDQFISSFTVVDDQGRTWSSGGLVELTQYAGDDWSADLIISGTHHYEDSDSWMDDVQSVVLLVDAHRDGEGLHVDLTGGLLLSSYALDFHDLHFEPECVNAPSGTIGLREAGGDWYDLVFEADCSGCATTLWRGQDLGTACLEPSTWIEDLARDMGHDP